MPESIETYRYWNFPCNEAGVKVNIFEFSKMYPPWKVEKIRKSTIHNLTTKGGTKTVQGPSILLNIAGIDPQKARHGQTWIGGRWGGRKCHVGVGSNCIQYHLQFHNSTAKPCMNVVPVHGDSLMIGTGERAKGAMVSLVVIELRLSSSWSIVVTNRSLVANRLAIQYLNE